MTEQRTEIVPSPDEALSLLYVLLRRHEVWGYNGSETACSCDHRWRSLHDHAEHHTAHLLAAGVTVTWPTEGGESDE